MRAGDSERVEKVKNLLGLSVNTSKEDMRERHREIIEEIEEG